MHFYVDTSTYGTTGIYLHIRVNAISKISVHYVNTKVNDSPWEVRSIDVEKLSAVFFASGFINYLDKRQRDRVH